MSRSIHRLLFFVFLSALLLAGPLGAAPSLPAEPADSQLSPSLLDTFLTFVASFWTVETATATAVDANTSGSGSGSTNSGSCIDPLGSPACAK